MRQISLVITLFVFLTIGSHAQSYQKTDLGIKAKINSTDIEIQFYGPSSVRVLKSPEGKSFTKETHMFSDLIMLS